TTTEGRPRDGANRVLLVVIDGLRADVAETIPFLALLAQGGARGRLWADPPTSSAPQYVALLAGVPPRDSGRRTNLAIRVAGVDDVALRARQAGGRTVALSTEVDWWSRLFPRSFDLAQVEPPEWIVAEAGNWMPGTTFALVHLCAVDEAGHDYGASSPQYTAAAQAAGRTAEELAYAWGWPKATVVVLADHGHRPCGGHGGDEPDVSQTPFYAAGARISAGVDIGYGRSIDVAPTLAALLDVAAPAQASGRTLVKTLDLPATALATLASADQDRVVRVARATALRRAELARAETIARAVRGAAILAILLLALARSRASLRRWHAWATLRGLVATGGAIATTVLIYGPVSFSAARRAVLWAGGMGLASFLATLTALLLPAIIRSGKQCRFDLPTPTEIGAVVIGCAPPAVAAFVYAGLFASRLTCEPGWVAAAPMFAYLAFGGATFAGTLVATAAALANTASRGEVVQSRDHLAGTGGQDAPE
ncbi:MAG TPA: alkaline phosphatase family protein, partial [Polyangia bacterium]